MKVRPLDESGYPMDFASVRLKKRVTVEAIPKPGDSIQLTSRSGRPFDATVTRAEWSEGLNMFVLSCQYGNRSISAEEYGALAEDPEWEMKPLI
jgi:hypothetical protein